MEHTTNPKEHDMTVDTDEALNGFLSTLKTEREEAAAPPVPFKVGGRVRIKNTGRYDGYGTVVKINPKTIRVTADATGGRSLVADRAYLVALADGAPEPTVASILATPIRTDLDLGVIVRVPNSPKIVGLYVVVKVGDRINISRLGGENGRYWRCSPNSLVVVPLSDVLKEGV